MRYEQFTAGEAIVRSLRAPTEACANVTQGTSRATGVTANGYQGAITTDTSSLAAAAEATFTVTNNKVKAGFIPLLALATASATGLSIPFVSAVADGSFDITLSNLHASTADTSASVINYYIINGNP